MDYCIPGGMPAVVREYIGKGTFEGTLDIQRQLLNDYREDIRKYAEGMYQTRILNFPELPLKGNYDETKYKLYFFDTGIFVAMLDEDFFVRTKDYLLPVEVKATNGTAKSLRTLIKSNCYPEIQCGIKFTSGNIGYSDNIYTFPYFCAFLLRDYLKEVSLTKHFGNGYKKLNI